MQESVTRCGGTKIQILGHVRRVGVTCPLCHCFLVVLLCGLRSRVSQLSALCVCACVGVCVCTCERVPSLSGCVCRGGSLGFVVADRHWAMGELRELRELREMRELSVNFK